MKKTDHTVRPPNRRSLHPGFEKTTHNLCPRCRTRDLTVYFRSKSPRRVGAYCHSCGLVGFYAKNGFFELGKLAPRLASTQSTYVVNPT
jgi:RNase P subunit RPR2